MTGWTHLYLGQRHRSCGSAARQRGAAPASGRTRTHVLSLGVWFGVALGLIFGWAGSSAFGQPSLDELLGLEDPAEAGTDTVGAIPGEDAPDAVDDPSRAELERALEATRPSDDISAAALKMADAAAQLEAGRTDTEIQRLQEDVIRLLDQAIDKQRQQQNDAQNNQSSSSSSSSSGDDPQNSGSMQQQSQSSGQQASRGGEGDGENAEQLPDAQDAELAERLEASRAAWGALPQRTRDALLQGSSDRFSSLYRRLTEEYYRRLAEDRR